MEKRLMDERREEIINACEQLYKKLDFKDINIKLIGEQTSFGRTSIYNYFQTKEEIFLALVDRWKNEEALDLHHKSEMMKEIAELRNKYNLSMKVEKFRGGN